MPEYNRVRDPSTGHEFTIGPVYNDQLEVLDEPAIDGAGNPLPAKHAAPKGSGELKGQALDDALATAGLSTSGTAAEKRERLTTHNEGA